MVNKKEQDLEKDIVNNDGKAMTTNQGLKVSEDENSLRAGERGPTLLEDFHFREKMTHFDHERIPERIVHARGFGAHGEFELYEDLSEYTYADFLTDTSKKTPVFVRISTVQGSKGSPDAVRDVRGFATKFYTDQGVFDLVGNNIPVFFIQDAIKFPDLIHAVKPEPHNEMPQGGSAHDTFWDFFAQNPESTHTAMWAMSDRGIPKNIRQIEGFGVHTFRLVNKEGKAHFVKFHWKPVHGLESMVWDEAQIVCGKDIDFHRKDLYESIAKGDYPAWELGLQILPEEDEFKFDFDILDPTKIWPEDEVPVKKVGKMTLNRNVDNVFAETEQVAFHPGHIVPGLDFTNDPLLQGRLFSYTDTQISRLGGPNFHQIPINRSVAPVHNNQRDGMHQMNVHRGQTAYHKNAINNNDPHTTPQSEGGFAHYQEKIDAHKIQKRSESFKDYYSQAKLYLNSLKPHEFDHTVDGFSFELGKCEKVEVKQNAVNQLNKVDRKLAERVAENIGVEVPEVNEEVRSDKSDSQLTLEKFERPLPGHSVAIVVDGEVDEETLKAYAKTAANNKLNYAFISHKPKHITESFGITETFDTVHPVLFDSLVTLSDDTPLSKEAEFFMEQSFVHCKPLVLTETAKANLNSDKVDVTQPGVFVSNEANAIVEQFKEVRYWDREV
ncbi:catalase [Staphylococcus massiliensis]|uniref:Catalase n=1 Tax=Staphylococcus massiliensis S46 TaxID=1229783 RepID=K9ASH1_9STAP|nr:catalase [Staphylococcus massiliensis]EKU49001.1 catalase [Staphylococcus massiliensis S46]MCG3399444.1 catalase [Staphylococcus massiliensis]MCG3402457.1 catalase [Staphylococcus massiliensis]MCG3411580.1 catalase [Staphylococcus massiliensis]PNZ99477.1 catalase HPII [Staphylococcus massiliensis CCUG 55927]